MQLWLIILICLLYLLFLFGIAYFAEYRSEKGGGLIGHPLIYALSLTTYCTAWTFYGSVGKAATTGIGFLPTYLGPIILAAGWVYLFKIIIRICKSQRITSIADFIASRYDKSNFIGALVAIVSLMSIIPYISIQLKAISASFTILVNFSALEGNSYFERGTALATAVIMSLFIIIFGTRKVDASERQEGMVYAIAFEAVFKLVAFLILGVYVTYGIFNGFTDIFQQAGEQHLLEKVTSVSSATKGGYWDWFMLVNLSFLVFVLLPRQFYLIAVQNTDEDHSHTATWAFPLYLLIINIFIIPLALGGLLYFDQVAIDADTYVLHFPILNNQRLIAMIVFLGGFAAATGMIIASAYALSMMLSNNMILPTFVQSVKRIRDARIPGLILNIRRLSIIMVMMVAYVFLIVVGKDYPLVEIGLVSFVGISQLAPAFFGALFWRHGNKYGVATGLISGIFVWLYTLVFPTLIMAELLPFKTVLSEGLFGLSMLKPHALFGFGGMGHMAHSTFWSLGLNSGLYVLVSLSTKTSLREIEQAEKFYAGRTNLIESGFRLGYENNSVPFFKVRQLLERFFGEHDTVRLLREYKEEYGITFKSGDKVNANFINYTESLLTGAVGSSAARILVCKIIEQKAVEAGVVLNVISETKEMISYSKELEIKSKQLEITSMQLQHANQRLQQLDELKSEFISTVTHELRTPLTSIRAFSEMLSDEKYAHRIKDRKYEFLKIISDESDRLGKLIDEILVFEKLDQDKAPFDLQEAEIGEIVRESLHTLHPMAQEKGVLLIDDTAGCLSPVCVDKDKVKQVVINLVCNAIKFCDEAKPIKKVEISASEKGGRVLITVADNGIGIAEEDQDYIFEGFAQVNHLETNDKPKGSGLGLAISEKIIKKHGGSISVKSRYGEGSAFSFSLPIDKKGTGI